MLCKQCGTMMKTGAEYGHGKSGGMFSCRRYLICKKCWNRFYIRDSDFRIYINVTSQK